MDGTVHLRQKTSASSDPAAWDLLPQLVSAVSIPVIANGDVYTRSDAANLVRAAKIINVSQIYLAYCHFLFCVLPDGSSRCVPLGAVGL